MRGPISKLFISPKATIKEAMQTIHRAASYKLPVGITLVVESGKLTGVVTDGDIRKAIIEGAKLSQTVDKIMVKEPITVDGGLSPEETN